jgi:quinol monooxygenase YgiN/sugar lactone lactonase YvrE
MKKITILILVLGFIGCNQAQRQSSRDTYTPKLLLSLPQQYNTPDGATLGKDGNIYLSVNNFNDGYLIENKIIDQPNPACILGIDPKNELQEFYRFKKEDLHPKTGFIGPMDLAFGPDGNLYVADMQIGFDPMHQSRLVRINIENNQAISMDVLVEGFIASNGMVWHGNTLYVTESILEHLPQGQHGGLLTSGVYAFDLNEFKDLKQPIRLSPHHVQPDPHLAITFKRNAQGFGADGIDVDDAGNLFTTVSGAVYKTVTGVNGKEIKTTLFAENPNVTQSFDGIVWHNRTRKFYTVGFFENALYTIDENGTIETLHQNGDTDGSGGLLDQPAEPVFRGDELIIVNMDLGDYLPDDLNSKPDEPYTLSRVDLSGLESVKLPTIDRLTDEDVYPMLVQLQVNNRDYNPLFKDALIGDVDGALTEQGNVIMELFQSADDDNTYFLYEIWENRNALLTHFQKPWTQKAFEAGSKAQVDAQFYYLEAIDPLRENELKSPNPESESADMVIFFDVKPEAINQFESVFRDAIDNSRQEEGVLSYQLYKILGSSSNQYVLYERWESQQALQTHIEQEHLQSLFGMFQEALVESPFLPDGEFKGLNRIVEIAPINRKR